MFVFITPVTDLIVMKWAGSINQKTLSSEQLYFARSVKFVLVTAIFALGLYSRIYREDITQNFAKRVTVAQDEANKQPLLQAPVELQG